MDDVFKYVIIPHILDDAPTTIRMIRVSKSVQDMIHDYVDRTMKLPMFYIYDDRVGEQWFNRELIDEFVLYCWHHGCQKKYMLAQLAPNVYDSFVSLKYYSSLLLLSGSNLWQAKPDQVHHTTLIKLIDDGRYTYDEVVTWLMQRQTRWRRWGRFVFNEQNTTYLDTLPAITGHLVARRNDQLKHLFARYNNQLTTFGSTYNLIWCCGVANPEYIMKLVVDSTIDPNMITDTHGVAPMIHKAMLRKQRLAIRVPPHKEKQARHCPKQRPCRR
jgi:hypothetical protein